VVSAVTNKTTIVPFKELAKPNGDLEVTLHPGDMVIVPKSGFEKVSYVFTKITSFATLVTIGALLH
jgi:polysaccharide biosynthesis/export protein